MVFENDTGYMISFAVYTRSEYNELVQRNATMDPTCNVTTKTVMGLLEAGSLLDIHRHVWFDNLKCLHATHMEQGLLGLVIKDFPKLFLERKSNSNMVKQIIVGMDICCAYGAVINDESPC